VTAGVELRERQRQYYERYYRDVLGIPDWRALVDHREGEDEHERVRLGRVRALVGDALAKGPILNVGCGTGGFNVAAEASGARVVGVDADAEAIGICALRRRGGGFVRAASEALPFRDGAFALVHCFSVIEHVASVDATVAEMVRVTRRGGAIYVHTPNAWSLYEGHYKLFWIPFLPGPLARAYLSLRGRPTAYLKTLRRLTTDRLLGAFRRSGVTRVELGAGDRGRETVGPLRALAGVYYRLTRATPFIELVAHKS
jgi:2-polyprenyl-3-methyl-5-hydroxy-6-metoxy-1,4-benzoquinol methylase